MSKVGVVVVTHASADLVPALLRDLADHEPDLPVVVVDDASPDGPPPTEGAELIVNPDNRGYAASCNRGTDALRRHDVGHVAFLNPDVRLRGPSLTQLGATLDQRPGIGIATGPITTLDGHRLPSAWGRTSVRRALAFAAGLDPVRHRAAAGTVLGTRVPTADASQLKDDLEVDGHVIGGTMIARIACLDEVGGFDEDFFLYWEDADLCHRAREGGWEVRVLPCTPFMHVEEPPSARITDEDRWRWFVEGAHRFGAKHLVPGQARQLEAALDLGRRIQRLRERG